MNRTRVLIISVLVGMGVLLAVPADAADPTPGDGIDLSVVVGGTGTTGTTGTTGGSSSHHSSSGGSASFTDSDPEAQTTPDVAVAEPVDESAATSTTLLDVSGLRTTYRASFDPSGGRLLVRFVVRNSSHRTIDATALFWATHVTGGHIGPAQSSTVNGLRPGESRTVEQVLSGVGQWTLVTAHARLTPTEVAGAPAIAPVERDRTVVVIPWALLSLLLVVAVAVVTARRAGPAPMAPLPAAPPSAPAPSAPLVPSA